MNRIKVKIKKMHPDAVTPSYARSGDAAFDLTAISKEIDNYGNVHYDTGLAFEIPETHVLLLFPRSSISKKDLDLSNCVGVIDSGYRGSVSFKFHRSNKDGMRAYRADLGEYNVYDRIGQGIVIERPFVDFEEVEELSETERGAGGYGHTGN